jgi:hypothetical protein
MRLRCPLVLLLLLAALAASRPANRAEAEPKPAAQPQALDEAFTRHVMPFFDRYCLRCHRGWRARGDVNLEKLTRSNTLTVERKTWELVLENIKSRAMPPRGRKPRQDEIDRIAAELEGRLGKLDCTLSRDPGRVTIRRLNRAEYNNTIRDLVGVRFQPARDFPADDVGYGFDNIGDVLSLPPILMEKYLAAADTIVRAAFKDPQLRRRLLITPANDQSKTAACKVIENFARRAFRRPVSAEEVNKLAGFVDLARKNGDGFETGIQLALEAVLVSPHFLFRVELDREPNNPRAAHPVSEYELATRLSYFLWSSMPDEELFRLAGQGALRKPGNLEAQVRRMLRDPKAHALVENFAGQWLQLRNLQTMTPNPAQFPTFNDALRIAMLRETELFFEAVVREDRSILDFLNADFTFLNERLARHYGVAGVKGEQFRRVKLTGGVRGGVLTQASILTITSNPTRTSPVKRGKWILENILGTPPPPPPPNVPELSDDRNVVLSGSLRQRMEKHRSNTLCASCHQRMDPLGFGFENFDAVGAWRDRDGNFAIDPSGTLPGGQSFKGPRELKTILKGRAPEFSRCLAEKLLTYAMGRGLEYYDRCAVDKIVQAQAAAHYKFTSLVIDVVKSEPFQMRRGKKGGKR